MNMIVSKKLLLSAIATIVISASAHASLLLTFDANNPDSLAQTLPNSIVLGGASSVSIVAGSGSTPDRVRLHSQLATDGESSFSYAIASSVNIQQHSFLTTGQQTRFNFADVSQAGGYAVIMRLGVFSANPNNVQPTSDYGSAFGIYFEFSTVNNTLHVIQRYNRANTTLGSALLPNGTFEDLAFTTDGNSYSASYTRDGATVIFAQGSFQNAFSADTWGSTSQLYLQSIRLNNTAAVYGDLYVGSIGVNAIPEASTYAWIFGSVALAVVAMRLKRRVRA